MLNMEGEDDFEVEYSTEELVQLVQDGEHVLDSMEVDPLIVDSSDDESKVVKLSDAQKYAKDVLNFMASQGSQIFNTLELLGMEKSHDKLIRIGVAHLTSTKQCDIRSFFVSSERSLPDLNDTLWCALVVIHNFELDFTFKNIEISYLLFSFLHCNFILIFYIFFDNITLCTKCDIINYVTPCLYHTFWWNGWCDIIKVRV